MVDRMSMPPFMNRFMEQQKPAPKRGGRELTSLDDFLEEDGILDEVRENAHRAIVDHMTARIAAGATGNLLDDYGTALGVISLLNNMLFAQSGFAASLTEEQKAQFPYPGWAETEQLVRHMYMDHLMAHYTEIELSSTPPRE